MYFELIFDNLDKVLSQYDKTIVMYGADWCNDCVDTKLLFKKLSEKYEDIAFIYSDSDNLNYSRSFVEFETIPTFAVFENDNLVAHEFAVDTKTIKNLLDEIIK
jgi:thiol-disulfide isomerase/thioredoxin